MAGGRSIWVSDTAFNVFHSCDHLVFDGMTVTVDGRVVTISGGGGGTSNHASLSNLSWIVSGHTGTGNRLAGFDGSGNAGLITLTSPLSLSGGALSVDLSAYLTTAAAAATYLSISDAAATYLTIAGAAAGYQPLDADLTALAGLGNGLPYRSGGSWAAYGLGDLAINAGSIEVATVGGSPAATVAGQRTAHETAYDHSSMASTTIPTGDIVFGSGIDGDLDLNGGAATGFTLVSTVYRATHNVNASNLTIRAGFSIDVNGWPIRVRNTLTMENATFISNDGGNASGLSAGAGALPASAPSATSAPFYGGSAGGGPRTSTGVGTSPGTPTGIKLGGPGWTTQSAPSGGGATTTQAVGASNVGTAYARYNGDPYQLLSGFMRLLNGTSVNYATGGTGGSSGAFSYTSGATGYSGPGGGGGGVVVVAARKLVTSGTSHRFSANGGNGGNANPTGGVNVATGGGQGGQGGYVLVQIGQVVSGTAPIVQVNGGNGGNGAEFGYVSGSANGGNGGTGGVGLYVIGTYSGGTPANTATGGTPGTGSAHGISGSAGAAGSVYYPGPYT